MPFFICPRCKTRRMSEDGHEGLSREPPSCHHCDFGEMFQLLEDYYPAQATGLIVCDDEGRVLGEVLEDPDREDVSPTGELEWEALTSEVKVLLGELRPIEADILRQRFGLGTDQELTLKEIGDKYQLSRERIRQLQEQALAKMRRALARRDLM